MHWTSAAMMTVTALYATFTAWDWKSATPEQQRRALTTILVGTALSIITALIYIANRAALGMLQ